MTEAEIREALAAIAYRLLGDDEQRDLTADRRSALWGARDALEIELRNVRAGRRWGSP